MLLKFLKYDHWFDMKIPQYYKKPSYILEEEYNLAVLIASSLRYPPNIAAILWVGYHLHLKRQLSSSLLWWKHFSDRRRIKRLSLLKVDL